MDEKQAQSLNDFLDWKFGDTQRCSCFQRSNDWILLYKDGYIDFAFNWVTGNCYYTEEKAIIDVEQLQDLIIRKEIVPCQPKHRKN